MERLLGVASATRHERSGCSNEADYKHTDCSWRRPHWSVRCRTGSRDKPCWAPGRARGGSLVDKDRRAHKCRTEDKRGYREPQTWDSAKERHEANGTAVSRWLTGGAENEGARLGQCSGMTPERDPFPRGLVAGGRRGCRGSSASSAPGRRCARSDGGPGGVVARVERNLDRDGAV
jgi:hypothetical protein